MSTTHLIYIIDNAYKSVITVSISIFEYPTYLIKAQQGIDLLIIGYQPEQLLIDLNI